MAKTMDLYDLYLDKYLGAPELKEMWQGWSSKVRANVAIGLMMLEQEGWLADEENLAKVHEAVRENGLVGAMDLQKLFPAGMAHNALSEIRNQPWTSLTLSTRANNCIRRIQEPKIFTIGNLADMHYCNTIRIRNCGKVTRREIAEALRNAGIKKSDWYR